MADFKIKGVNRRLFKPRTLIAAVLVVALLVVAWTQRGNIASVLSAMSKGALVPLIAAAVLESVRIVFHSYAYTRSFKVIGFDVPLRLTIPAWFKAVFMNTVLPSGGTSGLAAVVDAARRRGVPVGSATSAALFTQTCFYCSMLVVIVIGFVVMAQSGTLQVRDVLIGCVMGVAAFAFLGLLAMGHYAPGLLQRFMRWVERLVVRACKAVRLKRQPGPWADSLVHSFSSAATELSRNPRRALAVFAAMLVAMAFDMLTFVASGVAFGVTRIDALFGGYVTALVFNSFNVTPGGVGVVEGLASAVLAGYGYPATQAVSAVLVYRALMYWIPFVIGGVTMHVTGAFGLGGGKAAEGSKPVGKVRSTVGAAGQRIVAGVSEMAEAAAAAAAARLSDVDAEPVYVHRRHPDATWHERLVSFVSDTIEFRTVVCALAVCATSVVAFVAAALPPDPVMVDVVTNHVLGHSPLDPVAMVVCAYLALMCVPGILIHDQGNWLTAMVALVGLGFATALSGHGVWASVLSIAALVVLSLCHGCFRRHGFFRSLTRLFRIMVYCVCVAVAYALVGALAVRGAIDPDPGVGGALWMGLQSLAVQPRIGGFELAEQARWFFGSVGAVRVTFTVAMLYVIGLLAARRIVDSRRPERRRAREAAHAEAQAAARRRKSERRARRAERRGEEGRWSRPENTTVRGGRSAEAVDRAAAADKREAEPTESGGTPDRSSGEGEERDVSRV